MMSDDGPRLPLEAYPAYELALVLAAPRLLARAPKVPARDEVLARLDDVLAFIDRMEREPTKDDPTAPIVSARPYVRVLRSSCAQWTPSRDAPASLRAAARELLVKGLGFRDPPEGWDDFDLKEPTPNGDADSIGECALGGIEPLRNT